MSEDLHGLLYINFYNGIFQIEAVLFNIKTENQFTGNEVKSL